MSCSTPMPAELPRKTLTAVLQVGETRLALAEFTRIGTREYGEPEPVWTKGKLRLARNHFAPPRAKAWIFLNGEKRGTPIELTHGLAGSRATVGYMVIR